MQNLKISLQLGVDDKIIDTWNKLFIRLIKDILSNIFLKEEEEKEV